MLSAPAPAEPRGLYFICINADIGRQFEFIQDTWLNDQHFQGLYSDPDPIAAGVTAVPNQTVVNLTFTVQSCPVRQKLPNLPNFITTRGGAYFFLPGINALRYIGSQK
jgi:deferrochelatase/peroxidase EfeB